MNFGELVIELKKLSGKSTLTDARCATFLNAGESYLEGRLALKKTQVYETYSVLANACTVDLTKVSVVSMVQLWDTTDLKWTSLQYVTFPQILELFPALDQSTVGTPAYWTMNPQDEDTTISVESSQQILLMPPLESSSSIRVYYTGQVGSFTGSTNAETTIWSVSYPLTLLNAAIMKIDASYGYSERTAALMASIEQDLDSIDHSLVREEMLVGNVMELNSSIWSSDLEDDYGD